MELIVGTAGWSIAGKDAAAFPAEGSTLERYSAVFDGVEINSSFHRRHRTSTWAKWAASVPEAFRFAVKLPKTITHMAKLVECEVQIEQFSAEIAPLGHKLGVVLVQLPPKLSFNAGVVTVFFNQLRSLTDAPIACEPRNASWFDREADTLLDRLQVARVAADPALTSIAAIPGGWRGLSYWRLHGSPAMYRSPYNDEALDGYARRISAVRTEEHRTWCVFDNTAASEATGNALSLAEKLASPASV